MISYAQNFEDVRLFRALRHVPNGLYLDIGAQDPVFDSVSLAFYQAGWRGIHVEPVAFYAERLRAERPDETVIQAAVTNKPGPITIYEIPGTGLSTGRCDIAEGHETKGYRSLPVVVPAIRLDRLFTLSKDEVHWLKIDVEGMEADVLASWGKSVVRPWILVIEATYPGSQVPADQSWVHHVRARGYQEVCFDGLSRFFVHESHWELAEAFASSPNVFDGFCISPNHFAAGEIGRIHEGELADAAANAAAVAAEERDGERDQVATLKDQLDLATREHRGALDSLVAERDRVQAMVIAGAERLAEAEREQREATVQLVSDFQRVERERSREARDREDALASLLREAEEKASVLQVDALEQRLASEQRHRDELALLNAGRQAAEIALSDRLRHAEGQSDTFRAVAHQAAAIVSSALNERPGRWQKIGYALGIAKPSPEIAQLARASLLLHEEPADKIDPNNGASRSQVSQERVSVSMPHDVHTILDLLNLPLTEFVDVSYDRLLGRTSDPEEAKARASVLRAGWGRRRLLVDISRSAEFRARQAHLLGDGPDEAFVGRLYETYLGRAPDPDGLGHYLNVLRNGKSRARVRDQIAGSREARAAGTFWFEFELLVADEVQNMQRLGRWFDRVRRQERRTNQDWEIARASVVQPTDPQREDAAANVIRELSQELEIVRGAITDAHGREQSAAAAVLELQHELRDRPGVTTAAALETVEAASLAPDARRTLSRLRHFSRTAPQSESLI